MNILMLGWELPPHNSGGLGVACLQMSRALAVQGASIDFVVPYDSHHPEADFMTIIPALPGAAPERYGLNAYDTHLVDAQRPDHGMRAIQKQYKKAVTSHVRKRKRSYDAVHAHDWLTMETGMEIKQRHNIPLVVHVHATEFDRAGNSFGNPLIHEIEEQGLLMADRIIAVSNITKQIIVSRYHIPADKVEVMHNALDVNSLQAEDIDHATYQYLRKLKSHGVTIVSTVTRFTVQKGLQHFLAAAARACEKDDKLVFLLVGDGEQRDELIHMSAELGIADKVFFTGFVRGKRWRDAFKVSDVFVMSSVSEPFGITALEAAHYKNALIITKQSGVSEVLQSIFTYDFWDIDALADRMVAISNSQALSGSLSSDVGREYSLITWEDVARRCLLMYKNLRPEGMPL